ncbi:cytochrome b [Sphingomonas sp. CGMCC 1.13654]|uniref:Cytochrome b n=1 Tax=Sphingomonas chungangi TaxID=2683589 RepID=A0A838LC08_9SPHN|nr:cytochrome b [Sphingomonas chungangi]MVW55640.1 cytochrome b [Sphingomonas chungangi]
MTRERYTGIAILLHWLIAAGIILNVALAWIWPHLADEQVRPAIDIHKSIGVTVLGLAIMRLLWRLTHRPPAYPAGYRPWERASSHAVHWLLYLIMFAMPLTGWIMDSAWKDAASHPMHYFGTFEWPRIAFFQHLDPATMDRLHGLFGAGHVAGAYALYALFSLHVGGALKHQWLDREAELQRMWPGRD